MSTDTVGLDIGRTAIKAVRLRRTLTGRESVTYYRQEIPPSDHQAIGDDQRAQLLKQFVQKHRLTGSRLMTALPCSDLLIRTLALPFQDARKLMQVVPSEVESMIPLPLEEVAVDYQLLAHRKEGMLTDRVAASQVLVAVAHRATLTRHVQQLTEAGIEPDAIRIDALALLSVVRRMSERQSARLEHLAIIDIGASKTTICLSYQGDPWLVRTIRCGTDHLTQGAIKRETSIQSKDEPQKRTLTVEQMEPGFSALVRELRSTLHAYEATSHNRLRCAWFCGGGAELKELPTELTRCLELEPISLPQLRRARCAPAYSVAFGLALTGHSTRIPFPRASAQLGSAIDLKRVMNTTLTHNQERRRRFWRIGLASLFILLLAVADLFIQVFLKEARLHELQTALRSQFHTEFAGVALVTDELDQARTTLQAVRKAKDLLGGEQQHMLPLLVDLVRHFPKGITLKVNALTIEPGTILIEAETDSFESMEKVKQSLLAFPEAREVMVRDARVGSTPNQVLFRVTVSRGSS